MLGFHCHMQSLVAASRGYTFHSVLRLLVEAASHVLEHRLQAHGLQELQHTGSVDAVFRCSFSVAFGIFPDQESNPCRLCRQTGSHPLCHQGSPSISQILK